MRGRQQRGPVAVGRARWQSLNSTTAAGPNCHFSAACKNFVVSHTVAPPNTAGQCPTIWRQCRWSLDRHLAALDYPRGVTGSRPGVASGFGTAQRNARPPSSRHCSSTDVHSVLVSNRTRPPPPQRHCRCKDATYRGADGFARFVQRRRAGAMPRCIAALVSVIALMTASAVEQPSKAEQSQEWVAIAYFRSTSSGDIVSSEQATFATQKECRRWLRHWANSDFWRAANVATPDCIGQDVGVGSITGDHEETSPRDQPDITSLMEGATP
jgi:hypothetical protein